MPSPPFDLKDQHIDPHPNSLDIFVIIPTRLKDVLIRRALASVTSQSHPPNHTVIVYDGPNDSWSDIEGLLTGICSTEISTIPNGRTSGISGAINSGLDFIKELYGPSCEGYVALLDDDDYWEKGYLRKCATHASICDVDWVISGLIRHDDRYPEGVRQNIPDNVQVGDFLIGNPNVQGSNLFVKFDKLMEAGGFSEELVSTTDRDICIKLLMIPDITIGFLHEHLVHHDCLSRSDRLSAKGSKVKKEGLRHFYAKYADTMTPGEDVAFRARAETLFGVTLSDLRPPCPECPMEVKRRTHRS